MLLLANGCELHKMSIKHYERKKKWKIDEYNRHFPLAEYLIPLIGDQKQVTILDVGAGAILTTGDQLEGVDVQITACDNLADEYRKIYGDLLYPIEQQNMEAMTYPDNSFDIVHCVNALDHCKSPRSAIAEMQRIAKKFVYLRHNENEGVEQKYSGLHRWNIEMAGDDVRFWNKRKQFFLSEFGEWNNVKKKEVFTTKYDFGEQIISIYAV